MSILKAKYVAAPINGTTVEPLALQTNDVDRVMISPTGAVAVVGALSAGSLQVGGVATDLRPLVSGTVNAGGTAPFPGSGGPANVDFTSIPSWVKRITIMFNGVSLSSTANILVQLGTGSTTYTTSGYVSTAVAAVGGGNSLVSATSGFTTYLSSAAGVLSGHMVITNVSGNTWVSSHIGKYSTGAVCSGAGDVSLGSVLTAVRVTSTSTDLFDAGTINIMWE